MYTYDISSVEFRKKLLGINQTGSLFDSKVKEVYIEERGFVQNRTHCLLNKSANFGVHNCRAKAMNEPKSNLNKVQEWYNCYLEQLIMLWGSICITKTFTS